MMDKPLPDVIADELQNADKFICENICKHGDQYKADQEKYDGENPTFKKYCKNCPVCGWFTH